MAVTWVVYNAQCGPMGTEIVVAMVRVTRLVGVADVILQLLAAVVAELSTRPVKRRPTVWTRRSSI